MGFELFRDSFGKIIFRIIMKQLSCLADICIGIPDITCPVWSEVRFNLFAKGITELMVNIDQILSAAGTDIKSLSCCL